jgi:Pin2-interacting protein X1
MAAQGWQPGDFLGAKNARHAEHYTAANASHIRVTIKDDNLGLGAKIGSGVGHGECTGLDAFKDLLGRLNGKDEDEIAKEKKSREDLKRAIYTERRWGSIRFVPGGFLIGDKIQHLIDSEAERVRKLGETPSAATEKSSSDSSSSSESDEEKPVEKPRKSKKRKLEEVNESVPEVVAVKVKKSKKSKKRKHEADQDEPESAVSTEEDPKALKKKSKKKSKKGGEDEMDVDDATAEAEKKRRKKEKKEKKEKKARKEEKSKKKSKRQAESADVSESSESSSGTTTKMSTSSTAATSSGNSTLVVQGIHAVRARNIAQKRLASMDTAALNQVSLGFPLIAVCVALVYGH